MPPTDDACAACGVVQAVLGAVIEVAVIKLFDWAEFIHAFRVCSLPLPRATCVGLEQGLISRVLLVCRWTVLSSWSCWRRPW